MDPVIRAYLIGTGLILSISFLMAYVAHRLVITRELRAEKRKLRESKRPKKCPKCFSENIGWTEREGFNCDAAGDGLILFGFLGLLFGLVGNRKRVNYCHSCGHRWTRAQA